jgi:hypothetical protein
MALRVNIYIYKKSLVCLSDKQASPLQLFLFWRCINENSPAVRYSFQSKTSLFAVEFNW